MIKILAIDHDEESLIHTKSLIKQAFPDALTFSALDCVIGIDLALSQDPDVILLDCSVPGLGAFEVCQKFKSDRKLCGIPVVLINALKTEKADCLRALDCGAEAFLSKPIDQFELTAQIRAMVKIKKANIEKQDEKDRLANLVEKQTIELKRSYLATLNLLEDIKNENYARGKSEQHFRLLIESSMDAVLLLKPDGEIMKANSAACQIFGRSEEELKQCGRKGIVDLSDPRFAVAVKNRLKTGKFFGEITGLRRDGSQFPMEVSSALFDEGSGNLLISMFIRDISERKAIEKVLYESLERYKNLTNISPVGIFNTDINGSTTFVNPKWCQISGLSFKEALGDGWLKAVHPDDKERLAQGWLEAVKLHDISYSDYRFVHSDGTVAWVMGQAIPEKNNENEIVGYIGTITDITERKLAEKVIKESEEKFSIAFLTSPYAITITKPSNGKFVEINNAFVTITGYTREEALDDSSIGLNLWLNNEDRKQVVLTLLKGGKVEGEEFQFKRKNNDVMTGLFSAQIINLNGESYILSSINDITDRKRAEEELKASKDYLYKIINAVASPIFVKDIEHKFCLVNSALCEMLNLLPEQLLGKTGLENFPQEQKSVFLAKDIEVFLTGKENINEELLTDGKGIIRTIITRKTLYTDLSGNKFLVGVFNDITERKKAEEALMESEKQFRELYQNVRMGLYRTTPNGKILMANQALLTMLGYSSFEQLAMRNLEEDGFEPSYQRSEFITKIEKYGEINDFESSWVRDDGCEFFVKESAKAIRDPQGNTLYYDGVAEDITEKKHAELALQENNSRLQLALKVANMAWWEMDMLTGNVVFEKRKAEMLGYLPEKFKHYKDFMALVHPDDYDNTMNAMQNHLTGQCDKYEIEYRILTQSGEYKWFYDIGSVVKKDSDNKPLNITGLVIDITDRKMAEMALTESEERFRAIFEQAGVGVALLNTMTGQFVRINQKYCDFLGYTKLEMLQKTFMDITYPEDTQLNKDKNNGLMEGYNTEYSLEKRYVRKDGKTIWGNLTISPLWKKGEKPLTYQHIAVVENITRRKQAEVALKASESRYRRLFESAKDGILILDAETGKIVDVNPYLKEMLGYSTKEFKEKAIWEIVFFKDVIANLEKFMELQQLEFARYSDLPIETADGRKIHVEFVSNVYLVDNKKVIQCNIRDISKRVMAENALNENNLFLQTLLDSIPAPVFYKDNKGRYTGFNKSFELFF